MSVPVMFFIFSLVVAAGAIGLDHARRKQAREQRKHRHAATH